jgi:HK97 gp10 family phage protein
VPRRSKLDVSGIRRMRKDAPAAIDRGVARGAGFIADLAEQLAPEDEGDLKATVRVEGVEGSGRRTVVAGGQSGPNKFVDYPAHVEYGTPDSPAQPFMTPAAKAINVSKEVKAELRKLKRR